jgi:hypothetical protein
MAAGYPPWPTPRNPVGEWRDEPPSQAGTESGSPQQASSVHTQPRFLGAPPSGHRLGEESGEVVPSPIDFIGSEPPVAARSEGDENER